MANILPAEVDIQLLKDEGGGLMMEEGITTITFYNGDFKAASEALCTQFTRVVASNPWLAGRLVKTDTGVQLRHPVMSPEVASVEVNSLFTSISAQETSLSFKLTPNSPYADICTEMFKSNANVVVENGYSLVGKNKPVTLLTLAESIAGKFALIFSMSHVVGDGRTYYEIFKMLQPGVAVRQLASTRVMNFSELMRDTCGRKELEWADSASTAFVFTVTMLPAMLGCGKKAKCYAFSLDDERVAAAKTAGAVDGGVPYVTTNDILTSTFFNECNARIGMMGFDCREKLEGIHKDLAGNYVSALVLDSEVFGTPARLRQMYSTQPYKTTARKLPGWCGCFGGDANFAMITNWLSFAGELVVLEGCEMAIHLPVKNPTHCVFNLMIPFASGLGKKGVICWTISSDEDELRTALPVGECVSRELFP